MDFEEMKNVMERVLVKKKINITKHNVWSMLSQRQGIAQLTNMVEPKEYARISDHAKKLFDEFSMIERECLTELANISFDTSEEEIIANIESLKYSSLLYAMMRGDDYAYDIWKIIEPKKVSK